MVLFTVLGMAMIAAGIVLAGYGDGLRRAARATGGDSRAMITADPRAAVTLRRGLALMAAGLVLAGIGAL